MPLLNANPELNNAMENFYKTIYSNTNASDLEQIIPREKTEEADAIAERMFEEFENDRR